MMADGDLFIHVEVEVTSGQTTGDKPTGATASGKPSSGAAEPRPKGTAT